MKISRNDMANLNAAINKYLKAKKAYENHNKTGRPHTLQNHFRLITLYNNVHNTKGNLVYLLGIPVKGRLSIRDRRLPFGYGYNRQVFKNALQRALIKRAANRTAGSALMRIKLPMNAVRGVARHL